MNNATNIVDLTPANPSDKGVQVRNYNLTGNSFNIIIPPGTYGEIQVTGSFTGEDITLDFEGFTRSKDSFPTDVMIITTGLNERQHCVITIYSDNAKTRLFYKNTYEHALVEKHLCITTTTKNKVVKKSKPKKVQKKKKQTKLSPPPPPPPPAPPVVPPVVQQVPTPVFLPFFVPSVHAQSQQVSPTTSYSTDILQRYS